MMNLSCRRALLSSKHGFKRNLSTIVLPRTRGVRRPKELIDIDSNTNIVNEKLLEIKKSNIIACDTEFLTDSYYEGNLELIQIKYNDTELAVDSTNIDRSVLTRLMKAMEDKPVLLHSMFYDVKLMHRSSDVYLKNVIDTQVAAKFAGYLRNVSLKDLIFDIVGVSLSKTETLSDWSRRPFTPDQISYALEDVRYLEQIWEHLEKQLIEKGRLDMFKEEMENQLQEKNFAMQDPETAWMTLRNFDKLDAESKVRCKHLMKWRELTAQLKNVRAPSILRNEALMSLCMKELKGPEDILGTQMIHDSQISMYGGAIAQVLMEEHPMEELKLPGHLRQLEAGERSLINLYNSVLQVVANEQGLASDMLCSRDDLTAMVTSDIKDLESMNLNVNRGWRKNIIGDRLMKIKDGDTISLKWDAKDSMIKMV